MGPDYGPRHEEAISAVCAFSPQHAGIAASLAECGPSFRNCLDGLPFPLEAQWAEIIAIAPEWQGYSYFEYGDQIVVVDPATFAIVATLPL
jgi:hypothetical protein